MTTSLTMLAWAWVEQSAAHWLPVLLDASLKGLVVLAVAGAVALAMRRKTSAAGRHLVWLLAMASLLVLPVLSVALPGWAVLPGWMNVEPKVAAPQAESPTAVAAPEVMPNWPGAGEGNMPELQPAAPTEAPAPAAHEVAAPQEPQRQLTAADVLPWVMVAWAAGALICLAPIVLGRISLWRLKHMARPITGGAWADLLREASERVGLRRPAALLVSDRRPMPMIWGIFRAKLLVPAEADEWSTQRRRVVLLHELAHAARWDCATKLLVSVVCALYWFNPLAWVAFRFFQREAEAACDDRVLAAGSEPSAYAEHILQIASGLQTNLLAAHSSIAMARKSKLEGRLLAILDTKRNRRRLTVLGIIVAVVVVASLLVPVSTMTATASDSDAAAEASQATDAEDKPATRYAATLSNGATVELLAVSNLHADPKQWWRPDGSKLEEAPCVGMKNPQEQYHYELVIRYEGPRDAGDRWDVPGASTITNTGRPRDKDGEPIEDLRLLGAGFQDTPTAATVRYGVATGEWQTLAVCSPDGKMSFPRELPVGRVVMSVDESENGMTVIRMATTIIEPAARVVAVKKSSGTGTARYITSRGTTGRGATGITMQTRRFEVPLEEIERFEFQSRPYEWVEFQKVSLVPGRKFQVRVVTKETGLASMLARAEVQYAALCVAMDKRHWAAAHDPARQVRDIFRDLCEALGVDIRRDSLKLRGRLDSGAERQLDRLVALKREIEARFGSTDSDLFRLFEDISEWSDEVKDDVRDKEYDKLPEHFAELQRSWRLFARRLGRKTNAFVGSDTRPAEGGQALIRGEQGPSSVQAARAQLAARTLEVEQRRLKLLRVLASQGQATANEVQRQELKVLQAKLRLVELTQGVESSAAVQARMDLAERSVALEERKLSLLRILVKEGKAPRTEVMEQERKVLETKLRLVELSHDPATQPGEKATGQVSPQLKAERDKLLAEADAKIRKGIVALAEKFPHLREGGEYWEVVPTPGKPGIRKKGKYWRNINIPSQPGHISISLYNTDQGKAATAKQMPAQERVVVAVHLAKPPTGPAQQGGMIYPGLGLFGQLRAAAGAPELDAALKKLVADAVAPLAKLEQQVSTGASQPASGKLELRIAPSASALDKAELSSYMNWLKAGKVGFWWKDGRIAGIAGRMPDHAWLPIAGELTNAPRLITGQYQGRKYVLVSDKPGQTMVPGKGENAWGLVKVYKTTDNSGRPIVGFKLDERGAELFAALAKANVKNALAIVVDGKVLSAPVLMTALGKSGGISGRFSEQKVKDLIRALKIGMPPAPHGASMQAASYGKKVFIPAADKAKGASMILDLRTGELVSAPKDHPLTYFAELGKGDLAYDTHLICIRGAKAKAFEGDKATGLSSIGGAPGTLVYEIPHVPYTFLVNTRESADYIVKVLSTSSDGIEVEYRPFTNRHAAPTKELSFGPVLERVVNHTGVNCVIDLDTGKLVTLPQEAFQNGSESAFEWVRDNGIDAGGGAQPTVRGLIGFDIIAFPWKNEAWEKWSAHTLANNRDLTLKLSTPGSPVFLSAKGGTPATYIFQTREGGVGILQILEVKENLHTRIRYKMLQGAKATQPGEGAQALIRGDQRPSSVQAARAQLVARTLEIEEQHLKRLRLLASHGRASANEVQRQELKVLQAKLRLAELSHDPVPHGASTQPGT